MYDDRRKFSLGTVLLQLALIVLFVFIMIWLFPTKSFLDNNQVNEGNLKENLIPLYERIFNDNIESMRDAAKDYFTAERLPKKVGASVKLTLKEMLDKKLILPFKDSNNESCNVEESYVELVKMDNEYQMKVQLTCSDYSNYIIDYIGCYGYCESDCVAKEEPTKPVTKPQVKPSTPEEPKPVVKKYTYEYRLVTENTYSNWGAWSDWSTKAVTANNLTQVEKKTNSVFAGYERLYGIVDYKEEVVTTYKEEKKQVQVGTKKQEVGTTVLTKDAVYSADKYSDWSYKGYVVFNYAVSTAVSNTSTVKYVYVSDKTVLDCSDVCKNVTEYTYKKYTRSYTKGSYSCASYGADWKLDGTKCTKTVTVYKDVPVYEEVVEKVPVETVVKKPVYGYYNGDPIYTKVVTYRYRTRTQLTVAGVDYKWSNTKEDKTLLDKGYVLTGKSKEV